MKSNKTTREYGTQFEFCMRRVFGNDAYHIAGSCLDEKFRQQWIQKLLKQLIHDAQDIDTTQKHREDLSYRLESLHKKKWIGDDVSWIIVFELLMLITELMGYQGASGKRMYIPMFWQSLKTHLSIANARGEGEETQQKFSSAAKNRAEVVRFLKDKGLSDFDVAMALKTSEYEVKKLKKGI